jgi:hypothetical protein
MSRERSVFPEVGPQARLPGKCFEHAIRKGEKFMSDILIPVLFLIVGFVGGYFFGKTKVAKELETKAGKIGDVIKH